MKKKFMLILILALVVMTGSLRAELGSNLLDGMVYPGFEDPNMADWTLVNGFTAVTSTTASTGSASLRYDDAWAGTYLGIADGGQPDAALGMPDQIPMTADTDYLAGAWFKDGGSAAPWSYLFTWDGVIANPAAVVVQPNYLGVPGGGAGTPVSADWTFQPAINNSGANGGNGLSFVLGGGGVYYVDDIVIAEIIDPNSPHVLAWGDNSAQQGIALDLRGYVAAGTDGAISTTTWSLVSGAGGVVFDPVDANEIGTTATFDTVGAYTLKLEAVDAAANTISVTVDYVVSAPTAGSASNPSPGDTTVGNAVDTDISWTPGALADSQLVYFDAGTGTPTTLVDTGDGTLSSVANSLLNGGSPLDPNEVYSWQVVSYLGATPTPGPVWTFTTVKGLTYHWPLDGNLNEVISGNNATGAVSYVTGADGVAGSAMAFTDVAFATSTSALGIAGNAPRTINCWFKVPDDGLNHPPFSYGDISGCGTMYEFWVSGTHGNRFFWHGWCGGYDSLGGTVVTYPFDTWTMATIAYDGTNVLVYQNAALISSVAVALNTVDTLATIGNGGYVNAGGAGNGGGEVDDVRVYDSALSVSEIQQLYLDMIGAAPHPINPVPADTSEHNSVDTGLGWTPGIGIDSQEVYFDAGTGTPTTLIATLTATDPNLSSVEIGGPLTGGADYSWQVVSYIGATPYPGPVWTFKTAIGLAYHWPLDGNLNEVISGNNGVPTGTITYVDGANGDPNGAISVSAADFVASTSLLGITGSSPRTISCWFNVSILGLQAPLSIGVAGAGCGETFEILTLANAYAEGHIWCGETQAGATVPYSLNKWTMATFVYDGTAVTFYQDALANGGFNATLLTADAVASIGGRTGLAYAGLLDDVRVYDVALSEAEIAQLYLDHLGVPYICQNPPAMDIAGDDCIVDLLDIQAFVAGWLDCNRFPLSACP